jgi:DNA repair protein RecO (recombination protein O)
MTESTQGIILRLRPLTETSLIVNWLTPDLGRIATVAKGARRAKSPFGGKLDLFYTADFSFSRNRRSELHLLREANLKETHGAIRQDVGKLRKASYAVAFIEKASEVETPLPEIFELTRAFLRGLCDQSPEPIHIFSLEIKLLRELGLAPDVGETRLPIGTRKVIQTLLAGQGDDGMRLKLSNAQVSELRQFLHGFLMANLGGVPNGRDEALAETA